MKTFYLFKINNMFKTINNSNSLSIYKILEKIYNTDNYNFDYNYSLFKKICEPLNVTSINNYLLEIHDEEFYYYKKNNLHLIDNAYEKTILSVNNLYLKVKTDNRNNSFFENLVNDNFDFFVIDFENKNYFWLKENKTSIILK